MNSRFIFRIGLALALLASVSLKAIFHEGKDPRQPDRLNTALATLVTDADFNLLRRGSDRSVFIFAAKERCRIKITEAEPLGAGADATHAYAVDQGDVRYVFRGATYRTQPILPGATSYLLNLLRQHVFLGYSWEPVLVVGASPSCPVDSLPWRTVAAF